MRGQPERSWTFLLAAYVSVIAGIAGWVVFQLEGPFADHLLELSNTEGGSIAVELLNLPVWALLVLALARFGRFRMSELGVKRAGVGRAVVVTAILWAAVQVVQSVAAIVVGDPVGVRLSWLTSARGVVPFLVGWVSIAFGEEVFFRGFLQTQLSLKVRGRPAPVTAAVFLASAAFALAHLPRLVMKQQPVLPAMMTFLGIGIVLGALFHATRNLYLSIGIHALFNWPVLLFDETLNHTLVLSAVALAYTTIARDRTPTTVRGMPRTRQQCDVPADRVETALPHQLPPEKDRPAG